MPFAPREDIRSWGRVLRGEHKVAAPAFVDEVSGLMDQAKAQDETLLAIGARRSYGDSGLNVGESVIDTTRLDRLVNLDAERGIISAEAGLPLGQLLKFVLPHGFFLPVSPGTQHVTLGGAIANDVHGKNHHVAGTIGRWVREIELLRSNGERKYLTPDDASGLFAATVGGLGLTGIILRASLELPRVKGGWFDVETLPFGDVDEFFAIAEESEDSHDYNVAWVDVMVRGKGLGRGLFTRANHAQSASPLPSRRKPIAVPIDFPQLALNSLSISAFNALYYARGKASAGQKLMPYTSYLYPLDGINDWNKMYGAKGFFQYQSVVPPSDARDATVEMIKEISRAREGSFLVVLKTFGTLQSPGLLSFPMSGTTLALDFANRGPETLKLLARLDSIVFEAGGRLYPAKDGRMSQESFRRGYPAWEQFAAFCDPLLMSTFWRRMTEA